jgi:hypothetical protein
LINFVWCFFGKIHEIFDVIKRYCFCTILTYTLIHFQNTFCTGKSLSEALIFASTNPQYDDRLFIELQVQYVKIPSSNLRRTCCVQKFFLTFRTIFVHNMFSPCSAKRRASDKDLPVKLMSSFFWTREFPSLLPLYLELVFRVLAVKIIRLITQ